MSLTCGPWGTLTAGACAGGCTIPEGTDPAVIAAAEDQASAMLRLLSGNQIGVCETTIRPLGECPVCSRVPCCGAGDRVRLTTPYGPPTSVIEVRVDGVVTPGWVYYPSTGLLYRAGGESWPRRDVKADTATLAVDVTVGVEPDAWALAVWAELACEIVASCVGGKCRLPRNATSVSSQGVSISLTPDAIKHLIPSVSGWVASVNPVNKRAPSLVSSPDLTPDGGGSCGC